MKILKKGKVAEPKNKFEGICNSCGCHFLCTEKEADFQEEYGQDHPIYICPTPGCNQKVYLKEKNLRKAIYLAHHDDPPCEEKLEKIRGGNYCPKCKIHPDTQSISLRAYCPDCKVLLKNLKCRTCSTQFQKP
jgi:hypothetical protein